MRILLTGGSGLVGSNILESPRALLHQIAAPTSKELNLLSYEKTKEYLAQCQPDIVIHAAGKVGGIQANMSAPVDFMLQNLNSFSND